MAVILPTPGRIVWFFPVAPDTGRVRRHDAEAPLAAMIVAVKSDTSVNLVVFDAEGIPNGFPNVTLLQDEEGKDAPALDNKGNPLTSFAMWMPYQKGQASKTEALESQLQSELAALKTAADTIQNAGAAVQTSTAEAALGLPGASAAAPGGEQATAAGVAAPKK